MNNFKIRMDIPGQDNQAIEVEPRNESGRLLVSLEVRDRGMIPRLSLTPPLAKILVDAITESLRCLSDWADDDST
jgi:hypothetical protein